MYKITKNLVIILSMALLSIFTLWNILTFSAPIPGGVVESVYVTNSKIDLTEHLQEIAHDNHVLIAKQIIVPKGTPKNGFAGEYTFEKIGSGKLPRIFHEERDKKIIENSNDNTNYIIVGSGLSAKDLAEQLTASGNVASPLTTDARLVPIQDLMNTYRLPVLIILVSFSALLLAEYVSKIKGDGIRRLAGISRMRLAFYNVVKDGKMLLIILGLAVGLGSLYLFLTHQFWLAYLESLVLTLVLGSLVFFALSIILSTLVFYTLQNQRLNLSIKGKSPMTAIAVLVVFFQIIAVTVSMSSISAVSEANKQASLLQEAQSSWKYNKQYYAPTFVGGVMQIMQEHPDRLKDFLVDLLSQPGILLSSSTALSNSDSEKTWNETIKQYTYPLDGMPYINVLYANSALLDKEGVQLSQAVRNEFKTLKAGEYGILVPNSQKKNFETLTTIWTEIQSNTSPYLTKKPITSIYTSKSPLFGYSVMKNQFNNYSSIPEPLIIVYGPESFQKGTAEQVAVNTLAYLSNGQILTSNREAVMELFEKYDLQTYEGSFFNGYYAVSANLATQINKRNLLYGVNILCLLASLLLISLLNSIYLYQKRREFLIQRLAGKSWLDIHLVYLVTVVALMAMISGVAMLWLHVPAMALVVPVIYLVLVFGLFALQVWRGRRANVLYLKGL